MESLFNASVAEEIISRVDKLSPYTKGHWGKMDVAQMLAHCANVMEVAIADVKPPRSFMGRIIGPFAKRFLYNDKPFPKNSPTDHNFKIVDSREFEKEKLRLISLVNRFQAKGIEGLEKHKHQFFGSMTNEQWGRASYKHLSYHLNQFGV